MKIVTPYIHRDISWLGFNYRVLQEASDPNVPLLDRLKFLAIYSSNLGEFFRVRVANNRNLIRLGKKAKRGLGFEPEEVMAEVLRLVNEQQLEFSEIFFEQILPELRKNGINIIRRQEMDEEQRDFIEQYFTDYLLPFVQPVLLVKQKIKPFLNNASLYLALHLEDKKNHDRHYALVKVPSDHVDRFIDLPSHDDQQYIIMIDDVVRHCISWIFPGYDIIESYSMKLTRDAELYIDDEYSGDLLGKIKDSLSRRNVGPASRLVYDRTMPPHFLKYLRKTFELTDLDLLPEGRYHNNFDFFGLPAKNRKHLEEPPLPPIPVKEIEDRDTIFDKIKQRDYLIHPPYHSYLSVVTFFEAAANDPNVSHIKIVQYRVAKESRIMNALIKAAKKGKQVSVFIEVKARFDEEANLAWGERLEEAGVQVHYSIPGIKVHAKMASVIRHEEDENVVYSYFSTGNFHERTANVYSDFGLFTFDKRLTMESIKLFNYLETKKSEGIEFKHLKVGMFNMTETLIANIDREIAHVKKGRKGHIILKMNSLQDPAMIGHLYRASQAGVKIELIVRGICSIVPQVAGISDNITGRSIVDRYLEHARLFIFHNNGDKEYLMASADWMYRNLYRRIEVIFPIYNKEIQKHLDNLMDLQLMDNVKARSLNFKEINKYITEKDKLQIRSQMETYLYIKRNEQ